MVRQTRRRYIALRVHSEVSVGKGLLIKLIRDRTRELDHDAFSRIKPWLCYYQKGWAILKVVHLGRSDILSIIEDINGKEEKKKGLKIEVLGVSGTIKKAFYKYIPEEVRREKHFHEDREG